MPRGKPYSSEFKAKVVIESLREDQTLNELAAKYNITSKLISNWRSQFLGSCKSVFESHPAEKKIKDLEESLNNLAKAGADFKLCPDFQAKCAELNSSWETRRAVYSSNRRACSRSKLDEKKS